MTAVYRYLEMVEN